MSLTVEEKLSIVKDVKRHEKDTGSVEAQTAVLTARIKHLTEHFKDHKKDFHSKYGLQQLVNTRKKLLKYLKRKDNKSYISLISNLGLRDSY